MRTKNGGFTLSQQLIAISVVGVISAISSYVFIGYNQNLSEENDTKLADKISNDITNIWQIKNTRDGLISRDEVPSDIILNGLKDESGTTDASSIPSGCNVSLPAKKTTVLNGEWAIYAESSWQLAANRKDLMHYCLQKVNGQHVANHTLERYGQNNGNGHVIASVTSVNSSQNNTLSDIDADEFEETTVDNISNIDNNNTNNTNIDVTTTPTTVNYGITLNSEYTDSLINSASVTSIAITSDCNGAINVNNFTSAANIVIPLVANSNCSLMVTSVNSSNPTQVLYQGSPLPKTITTGNTNGSGSLKIQDRYLVKLSGKYEINNVNVGLNTTLDNGNGTQVSQAKSITGAVSSFFESYVPASLTPYSLKISGSGGHSIQDINASVVLTNSPYVNGGYVFKPGEAVALMYFHKSDLNIVGVALNVVYDLLHGIFRDERRRSNFYLKTLAFNFNTNVHEYIDSQFNSSQWNFVSTGGKRYAINKVTGKVIYTTSQKTPVKVNLDEQDAMVNSDDYFKLDSDGFDSDKIPALMTPGGLNIKEAWLVLDRNNNGTFRDGAIEDIDLFGDHDKKVKNGYVDLEQTFETEIKQDEKGRYIDLENYSWFDGVKLWFSRSFLGDKQKYAVSDLMLLKRDRTTELAREHFKRIYVNYTEVTEYDKEKKNAIFQRASVLTKNNQLKQSADQYFFFFNGGLDVVTDEKEVEAVHQALLDDLKKEGRMNEYNRMKAVFESNKSKEKDTLD